jgi:hypothetical protein
MTDIYLHQPYSKPSYILYHRQYGKYLLTKNERIYQGNQLFCLVSLYIM